MLPKTDTVLKDFQNVVYYPSLTYKLDFENKRIAGYVNREDAVEQALKLMTLIERNKYGIYDSDYGIETNDLIGKDPHYVQAVIEYRIKEACSIDERILDLYDFETRYEYDTLYVDFKLKSVYEEDVQEALVLKGIAT